MTARKGAAEPAPLTVSQLAARIDDTLKTGFAGAVRVAGEVSNFSDRTHWYFNLKDEGAVVACVAFQSVAKKIGFAPASGQQVLVKGRVEFYAPQGRLSLVVEGMQPVGAGAAELALKRLVEEVRALGWLDPSRKRALPSFPGRIAVITSRTGAALQDVLVTARKRCPAVAILVVDVRVQGEGAAAEIAEAVRLVGLRHGALGVDAILVTRGGGSIEDLWAFNDREVARAIVESPVPVVAAVGHETDTTLAELVADERCATPTQAAMRLTPDKAALVQQIDSAGRRLSGHLQRHLRHEQERLAALAARPALADPRQLTRDGAERLAQMLGMLKSAAAWRLQSASGQVDGWALRLERQQPRAVHARTWSRVQVAGHRLDAALKQATGGVDLAALAQRLARAGSALVTRAAAKVQARESHLTAIGPRSILSRGYSITTGPDGKLIRSQGDVKPGDVIATTVADGQIGSTVHAIGGGGGAPNRKKPRQGQQSAPPSLFG